MAESSHEKESGTHAKPVLAETQPYTRLVDQVTTTSSEPPMQRTQIVIPGNPGGVLARVAPALAEWLGPDGFVLGGGTVLAYYSPPPLDDHVPTVEERIAATNASASQTHVAAESTPGPR